MKRPWGMGRCGLLTVAALLAGLIGIAQAANAQSPSKVSHSMRSRNVAD
jgi:hypothetical protein